MSENPYAKLQGLAAAIREGGMGDRPVFDPRIRTGWTAETYREATAIREGAYPSPTAGSTITPPVPPADIPEPTADPLSPLMRYRLQTLLDDLERVRGSLIAVLGK